MENYTRTMERLIAALDSREAAGGDDRVGARAERRLVDEHQPDRRAAGEPCASCSQPWPCGVIEGVLAR